CSRPRVWSLTHIFSSISWFASIDRTQNEHCGGGRLRELVASLRFEGRIISICYFSEPDNWFKMGEIAVFSQSFSRNS
ncbi:MAG: hypothetical protein Q4G38_04385, partial [Aeriscardovia aeriphila]|nr:hypothetical protein [Aeriscardovia aeriphila]